MKKLTPVELAICSSLLLLVGTGFALPPLLLLGGITVISFMMPPRGTSRWEAPLASMGKPDVLPIVELMLTLLVAGLVMLGLATAGFFAYRMRVRSAADKWRQQRLLADLPGGNEKAPQRENMQEAEDRITPDAKTVKPTVPYPADDGPGPDG